MTYRELAKEILDPKWKGRLDEEVKITFDADNAWTTVTELFITKERDCCKGLIPHNVLVIRGD